MDENDMRRLAYNVVEGISRTNTLDVGMYFACTISSADWQLLHQLHQEEADRRERGTQLGTDPRRIGGVVPLQSPPGTAEPTAGRDSLGGTPARGTTESTDPESAGHRPGAAG